MSINARVGDVILCAHGNDTFLYSIPGNVLYSNDKCLAIIDKNEKGEKMMRCKCGKEWPMYYDSCVFITGPEADLFKLTQ